MRDIFTIKSQKCGFTLSEALITIAVIGVIAALTLPAVITNFQQNAMLASLKKSYVQLQHNLTYLKSERFTKATLTKSILSLANPKSNTLDTSVGQFFTEYYNISVDCGTNPSNGCFASKYSTISGSSVSFSCKSGSREGKSVLLKDGTAMCIIPANMSGTTFIPAVVFVDVNGQKTPNKAGKDLFTFNIYNDFSVDEESPEDIQDNKTRKSADNCRTKTSPLAEGCFGNILENNWKINY